MNPNIQIIKVILNCYFLSIDSLMDEEIIKISFTLLDLSRTPSFTDSEYWQSIRMIVEPNQLTYQTNPLDLLNHLQNLLQPLLET